MGTLEGKNALIVGLGKMNLLTLNHLEEENVKNNKLIQNPVEEINKLRKDKKYICS